ncbi:hypothetical protein CVIRNUC_006203 [Coccomyxa viridis]|uniref:Biopterin transport-related protein BT1 n=1 Tax=Coccomyxa viridis TaxID=1274662 RepID=A0AAV1I771_9CHLO|nr:hypothetical protein CVIRNUC_006203 [Coccomyxa viridis]
MMEGRSSYEESPVRSSSTEYDKPDDVLTPRKIAHRVGRISPLNVENARQEDGPPTPNKSRLQRFREWQFKPLGLEPSPELIALSVAYYVQGVKMSLGTLTENYYLKDDLSFDPPGADTWKAIAHVPWMIKPLYGLITDSLPIWGRRRRPYLIICGLAGFLAFGLLSLMPPAAGSALLLMTLGELAIAFSDVVIDGVVVECSRGADQATAGSLQSICWGSQAIGVLSSAYTSGWLIARVGARPVLGLMALFPLLMCFTAGLIREQRQPDLTFAEKSSPDGPITGSEGTDNGGLHRAYSGEQQVQLGLRGAAESREAVRGASQDHLGEHWELLGPTAVRSSSAAHALHAGVCRVSKVERVKAQLRTLWHAVLMPEILLPAAFIFLWQASPSPAGSMFFFYTNYLGFTPEFVGRIQLLDGVAQLLGVYLFNTFLRRVELRRLFFNLTLIGVAAGFTQLILVTGANRALGINDKVFVLVDSVLLTGLGRIALMPALVLAAKVCPEGVEATLYAALMSISNASGGVSELLGAALSKILGITAHEFAGMAWLVLICTVSGLLPLPFLRLVPDINEHSAVSTVEH